MEIFFLWLITKSFQLFLLNSISPENSSVWTQLLPNFVHWHSSHLWWFRIYYSKNRQSKNHWLSILWMSHTANSSNNWCNNTWTNTNKNWKVRTNSLNLVKFKKIWRNSEPSSPNTRPNLTKTIRLSWLCIISESLLKKFRRSVYRSIWLTIKSSRTDPSNNKKPMKKYFCFESSSILWLITTRPKLRSYMSLLKRNSNPKTLKLYYLKSIKA